MFRLRALGLTVSLVAGVMAVASPPADARGTYAKGLGLKGFSHLYAEHRRVGRVFISQGTSGGLYIGNSEGDREAKLSVLTGATDVEPAPGGGKVWTTLPSKHEIAEFPREVPRNSEVVRYAVGSACPTAVAPTSSGIWFVDACPQATPELDLLDPATRNVTPVLPLAASAAIVSDEQSTLYVASPAASGEFTVNSYQLDGGAAPSATPLDENAAVPGPSPRQLALSDDGAQLAASSGSVLSTADLSEVVSHPAPSSDRGATISTAGQVAIGDKSGIAVYLDGDGSSYNQADLGDEVLQPFGLDYSGKALDYVTKKGSHFRLHIRLFHAATSLTIRMSNGHPAYGQREHVTVSASGIPDGSKITLIFKSGALGEPAFTSTLTSGVAQFVTPPVMHKTTLVVQYAGDRDHDRAEVRRKLTYVHSLTDRPKHYLRKSHGLFRLRAGRDEPFVTHYRKVFAGACLGYRTDVNRAGKWAPYARVKGCLAVPASGINTITLPASLAHAGLRLRSRATIYPSRHWFKAGFHAIAFAPPLYFTLQR